LSFQGIRVNCSERFDDNACALSSITGVLGVVAITGYVLGFSRYHVLTTSAVLLSVNLGLAVILFAVAVYVEHPSIYTASKITACTSFIT
jgi:uncharacterized membrane protein YdcZ (DUF606 family)